jgi:hypothetical protein
MPTKKKPAKKKPSPKKASPKRKSTQKTLPTGASVATFLDRLTVAQRADAKALTEMMQRVTGESARMWGTAYVGFGNVHYKYESGHEGDAALVGFAPRKGSLTLYLWGDVFGEPLMQQLGKYKIGKSCLYVKQLADVDTSVLEKLVATSVTKVRSRFAGQ